MSQQRPIPSRVQKQIRVFLPVDLTQCTYVFISNDAVRAPLRPPYDGPFLVISRTYKYFRIQKDGKDAMMPVDRLKPAFTLEENIPSTVTDALREIEIPVVEPPLQIAASRSVRSIRCPVRFSQQLL